MLNLCFRVLVSLEWYDGASLDYKRSGLFPVAYCDAASKQSVSLRESAEVADTGALFQSSFLHGFLSFIDIESTHRRSCTVAQCR